MAVRFLEDLNVDGEVVSENLLVSSSQGNSSSYNWLVFNNEASGYGDWNFYKLSSNNLGLGYGVTGGSSYSNAITFKYGGNIGIGTTNPAYKLDVNGSLSSGQLYVNQNAAALNMVGTDHTYMQWFPAGLSGGRHAYTGFAGGGTNHFTIANETSGANIDLTTNSGTVNVTGNLSVSGTIDGVDIGANYANWNTAYGWGDHSSAGYLTSSSTQSKYLRSDANDSWTGKLTWAGSDYADGIDMSLGNINDAHYVDANEYRQRASGRPRNNLGDPTVTEMALFEEQFGPKTTLANDYDDLSDLTFWGQETSSSSWVEITSYSDDQKRKFLRTNSSSVIIPNTYYKFRVEFTAKGYTFANAMYMYWSSNSHNTQVHIWKKRCSDGTWLQHTSATNTISSWPGHGWLPFSNIPWHETNTTSTGHFTDIRVEFTPNWSTGSSSSNNINIYGMQIWGGYPKGRRTPHYYDQNGEFNFLKDAHLQDGKFLKLGTGNDLKLYHDGSNSYIDESGTGSLIIKASNNLALRSATDENYIYCTSNGNVRLYYDNAQKLETTSSGVKIAGSVGNLGSGIGQQLEQGSSAVATLRFDADRWRLYAGGGAGSEVFGVTEAGNVTVSGTVDGRDVAADGTKLDTIDTNADVTPSWVPSTDPNYLTGYTETNLFLGDGGTLTTAPGYNRLIYTGQISNGVSGLFAASDNSNSVITLNRHSGNYDSQLGFSSNGNVYYRKFSNTAINTTQGWGQLLISDTNGNVGINTTSPTEKLHVEGRIRLGSTPVICSHDNVGIDIDQNNNSGSNYFRVTRDGETTELFRVQENGNVGIGTTSPDHLLQVESSGNAEIQAQRVSGAGVLIQAQSAVGVVGTNTNHRLDLKTNSSTRATISTSGNFGIGTTSPAYKLSVNGDVQSDIFRGYTYPNNSFLDFDKDDTAVINYTALGSVGRIAYLADTNGNEPVANAAHEFFTGTSDIDTATSLMVIETDGNVGIGTTSPDTLLEVSKSTGAAVRITSTATGNGADVTLGSLEYYGNDASVPGAGIKSSIVAKTEASLGDDSNLIFSTSNGTTNNIERLRINSSGNVGIGTTSPSEKLEVDGNAIINGNLTSDNIFLPGDGIISFDDSLDGSDQYITGTDNALTIVGDNRNNLRATTETRFQTLAGSTYASIKPGGIYTAGDLDLGHESDTTIARASAGKVTIEGNEIQTTNVHHHFLNSGFYLSYPYSRYIPLNGSISEQNVPGSTPEYTGFIWPYDGYVKTIWVRSEANSGNTLMQLYKGTNGSTNGGTAMGSVTEACGAHTSVEFDFTGVTNSFSQGEGMAIKIDPTNTSQGVIVTIECVFNLTT